MPAELEQILAGLEKSYRSRETKDIVWTLFGTRRTPGGYEFYVISQEYRE